MFRRCLPALVAALITNVQASEDPFLWLEEVHGEKALAWVTEQNQRSLAVLEADPRFQPLYEDALDDLTRSDRLPDVTIIGDYVYDLLQDETHVRGLWRRMPVNAYIAGKQVWEPVLDVDALAEKEGRSWVFSGPQNGLSTDLTCLQPAQDRCMLRLSPGGSHAAVYREFDLNAKTWVEGGFELPEMKTSLAWIDRDTLLVAAADTPENSTTSGYGRVAKRWKRGTPFAAATTVASVPKEHMALGVMVMTDGDDDYVTLLDYETIFTPVASMLTDNGRVADLDLPSELVPAAVFRSQLVGRLSADWRQGERLFPQGSIISFDLNALQRSTLPEAKQVFAPTEQQSINMVATSGLHGTHDRLYFTMMDDVRGRLISLDYADGRWTSRQETFPDNGVIRVVTADDAGLIVTYEDLLTPPSQYFLSTDSQKTLIDSLDPRLDADSLTIEQHFAESPDGTRVPYFIARPKSWIPSKPRPTLMVAYGGFGFSMEPGYLGGLLGGYHAKAILANGGAFVLANIRGGGEYGPGWHQQGTLANRQRVYDDFHAIAEDLVARGYTTAEQLGIYGASNSGLLMGVAFTQRPDLYEAVLCGVPLLDMRRYHLLLAGASWIGEYGNPDDPELWAVIRQYSPYHNLKEDQDYPEVFFFTSTKDDHVHPGHARKMAAKMEAQGHPFLYFESIEGGHVAAADLNQKARLGALHAVYLMRKLGMPGSGDSSLNDQEVKSTAR